MSNWISYLNDNIKIGKLSIPGTHDSASFKQGSTSVVMPGVSAWWKCQEMDFEDQLNAGIRYFDLRFRYYPTSQNGRGFQEFHFHHASVYLGTPDYAMKVFSNFLKEHPKEFIIIQIQQQHSQLNRQQFGSKILAYMNRFNIPIFNWKDHKQWVPTIGDLRGKAWLIQAAHVKMGQFQIDTNEPIRMMIKGKHYVMQNAWKDPLNTFNYDQTKQKAIRDLCGQSNQNGDCLKINYISWEPGTRGCHNEFFEKIVYNYGCVGITIMDYPSKNLI